MENLFYSKDEKILFYVAGYTDNTPNVLELIQMLTDGMNEMVEIARCVHSGVNTKFIEKSSRYKYMRVFYCKTDEIPKQAFMIGGGENKWTMMQWLTT